MSMIPLFQYWLNRITRESALELIEELNLKLTWNVTLLPAELTTIANALGQNTQTITISGMKKDGTDSTNDLSYLFLEAYKNIKAFTTDLSVRVHKNTPKDFFKKGGMQIQPTVVSTETLQDAQKHPENYQDLIVKVGGYNATYVDLGIPIQNEIINRLENRI